MRVENSPEVFERRLINLRVKIFGAMILLLASFLLPVTVQAAERTIIILIRHGETEYNKEDRFQGTVDIPLDETGLKQADMLAESLKDVPIDVFISSPLKRAYVTTEKCAALHGMKVVYTDARLSEASYGDWAGQLRSDIKKKFPREYKLQSEQRWKFTPPHGESLKSMQKRYRAALDDIIAKYPGKTILVGAHSGGNITLLCSVLNINLNHYNQFEQDNTCVNVLAYENGEWRLLLMNSVEHLGYLYKGMK